MNPAFWRGKPVFVTGHTGFKGAWLVSWLRELGAQVCGYALAPETGPSLYEAADVGRGIRSIIGDVRDFEALSRAVGEARPAVVFHLAAQSLVRRGYARARDTFETNVVGTANLLDCLRNAPFVRAVVVVTSDKCYENREWIWPYREDEPLGGRDPYSASKACQEHVTRAFRDSFFSGTDAPRIASARAGNVVGGGDWAEDRLVPDMVRAISANRPLIVRRPGAVRPWQHVLEPLSGYLALAEKLCEGGSAFAGAWNFGPGESDARSVAWVADRLVSHWGDGARWQAGDEKGPHEAAQLRLDASKARELLGWYPRLHLDEALKWVVAWHKDHSTARDVSATTREQIRNYTALAASP